MVKCSDFVIEYIRKLGVSEVYMLSGGGIMHLVDSLGKSGVRYVCCHHEQACSIAAQASAMYSGKPAVCLVTTGPGGTNALTGAAAAYVDSTPVIFLSGQVKRDDFASKRGVRQFGAQENDIVSMAKPVVKYAAVVTDSNEMLYHLQKAAHMAQTGRQGPVWLDIPLDVQAELIDTDGLKTFTPDDEPICDISESVAETLEMLITSKRPLILAGHGVSAAGARDDLKKMAEQLGVPVMVTWRALGIFDSDDGLFMGSPGLQAPRYSNFILQSCDLLIVIGSRLDNMITAFNEQNFAPCAVKIMVDIDYNEIKKLNMESIKPIVCDAGLFINELLKQINGMEFNNYREWLNSCSNVKNNFPLSLEKQAVPEGVDLYRVTKEVSAFCKADDVIVITSTSRCNTAGHMAFECKSGQRFISSMGMGSMGFALPSAIGAHFASCGKRVIVFEGDGSLQLNIQELQTIRTHNIPAKIFIFSNNGYAAITTMQERNFDSNYVGSNALSGLEMPDLEKTASAYGIPYLRIAENDAINATVQKAMETEGAVICEIVGSLKFDEIPKCISSVREDGRRVSALLENPFPFLPEDEVADVMERLKECKF